ncbi:hypothetical protein ACIGXM_29625 [Kitasatospora sp. NPDC052896]|uniref:hypothetical protein n=1 Tax=Kitasatospora sp. NPDC052896 TaxID=3364061 RepID=UPI0037C76B7F
MEQNLCDVTAPRLLRSPQSGVEHVTLVSTPPGVTAMTFVVADDLLAAERAAVTAWARWLTRAWPRQWRLVSCAGDLQLGVLAAMEWYFPDDDPGNPADASSR